MPSAAQITVRRARGGRADWLRAYKVLVDDRVVGSVRGGKAQTFSVTPGRHRVQLRIDWCASAPLEMTLKPDEQVTLVCRPNGNPLIWFYWVTFGRRRYISLDRAS